MSEPKTHPPSVEELAARASLAVSERFPECVVRNVTPLFGGSSSLTYSADLILGRRHERVVVKVAPPGLPPIRNRDVLRQARVLDVLADAPGVAVPRVLGTDAGDPPEVPPFFVMTFVPGESLEPVFTEPGASVSDAEIEARALAAARMMARLHAVDPSPLDERVTDLAREVGRWDKALSTVDDDLRGGERADQVRDALLKSLPASLPPAILHGDYRLGNMQCEGATIGALIDWEIWSVGDPRLDLAWFLSNSDPRHPNSGGGHGGDAMPSTERLQAEYERAAGRSVDELAWFGALVRYKQAAAGALITKNARKLAKEGIDTDHTGALGPKLLDWALEILG
jgi:aminoglycoside phosphotransferase (APT) family kinase protein